MSVRRRQFTVLHELVAGWLGAFFQQPATGILLFSGCAVIPALTGFSLRESAVTTPKNDIPVLLPLVSEYRYLWYSSVVLVGITGIVISLYPKFSGMSSGDDRRHRRRLFGKMSAWLSTQQQARHRRAGQSRRLA